MNDAHPRRRPTVSTRLDRIREQLDDLSRRDHAHTLFGAAAPHGHGYRRQPVLGAAGVRELEAGFGVELPGELRAFLTNVHGGGAGPGYGLVVEPDRVRRPRRARPFPFDEAVARAVITQRLAGGSTRGKTVAAPDDEDDDDDDWPPGPGFIPIAHHGCGVFDVLVVAGQQRGYVWWCDMSWAPSYDGDGRPMGFLDWYESWLDSGLRPLSGGAG
jgi:hypothetical protein